MNGGATNGHRREWVNRPFKAGEHDAGWDGPDLK